MGILPHRAYNPSFPPTAPPKTKSNFNTPAAPSHGSLLPHHRRKSIPTPSLLCPSPPLVPVAGAPILPGRRPPPRKRNPGVGLVPPHLLPSPASPPLPVAYAPSVGAALASQWLNLLQLLLCTTFRSLLMGTTLSRLVFI